MAGLKNDSSPPKLPKKGSGEEENIGPKRPSLLGAMPNKLANGSVRDKRYYLVILRTIHLKMYV